MKEKKHTHNEIDTHVIAHMRAQKQKKRGEAISLYTL